MGHLRLANARVTPPDGILPRRQGRPPRLLVVTGAGLAVAPGLLAAARGHLDEVLQALDAPLEPG
ncbi:MAG: hypothetical protein ACRDQZ_22225 [Mycobacteriales bacterium]